MSSILFDLNNFMNRNSRQVFAVLICFVISMAAGYTVRYVLAMNSRYGTKHSCDKDSFEMVFRGVADESQAGEGGPPASDELFYRRPLLGYVRKPHSAVRIATALITQDYGAPCNIGIREYELYLCDSLWVVKCNAVIEGTPAELVVEINKESGRIWRIDKYPIP